MSKREEAADRWAEAVKQHGADSDEAWNALKDSLKDYTKATDEEEKDK